MSYNIAEKDIVEEITKALNKLGIMFRIFSRIKDNSSLEKKIKSDNKYINGSSKIQDLLGIRIVLYFPDDIQLSHKIISNLYEENSKDSSIDELKSNIFKPIRYNIIYKMPKGSHTISHKHANLIDLTFEVQIRTVLSEGWHEVEHDLRYKCKEDWVEHNDLSRALNGIYASLETSDWGIMKLFEDLAYRNYKSSAWSAMLRNKLRLRMDDKLDEKIISIINEKELGKKFYRIDRDRLLSLMLDYNIDIPINLNNIIYLCNYFFIKSTELQDIAPALIMKKLTDADEKFNKNTILASK